MEEKRILNIEELESVAGGGTVSINNLNAEERRQYIALRSKRDMTNRDFKNGLCDQETLDAAKRELREFERSMTKKYM